MPSFAEPERLTLIFDAPDREDWQKTSRILAQMDLQPAMQIADVGAGTGYFSQLFAERVPDGRVYALDNEPNMVAHMQRRFADAGTAQVEVRQSQAADPCLPAGWTGCLWPTSTVLLPIGRGSSPGCMRRWRSARAGCWWILRVARWCRLRWPVPSYRRPASWSACAISTPARTISCCILPAANLDADPRRVP